MPKFEQYFQARSADPELTPFSPQQIEASSMEIADRLGRNALNNLIHTNVISSYAIVGILEVPEEGSE